VCVCKWWVRVKNFWPGLGRVSHFLVWVWIWKIFPKNGKFFNFLHFGSKKMGAMKICRIVVIPKNCSIEWPHKLNSRSVEITISRNHDPSNSRSVEFMIRRIDFIPKRALKIEKSLLNKICSLMLWLHLCKILLL